MAPPPPNDKKMIICRRSPLLPLFSVKIFVDKRSERAMTGLMLVSPSLSSLECGSHLPIFVVEHFMPALNGPLSSAVDLQSDSFPPSAF